jgi:hypothetical protein
MTPHPESQQRRTVITRDSAKLFEMMLTPVVPPEKRETAIVLWVFRDYDDLWCVRKEGGDIEATFSSREDALAFARRTAAVWGAYRLFIELKDGRVTREIFNPGGRQHDHLVLGSK